MNVELPGESTLLTELRALAEGGRHRDLADRLDALPRAEVASRAPFALLAAEAHGRLAEYDTAADWAGAALSVAAARGDRHGELRAINVCGAIALERGDGADAERWFARALDVGREPPDHLAQARALNNLGIVANLKGDITGALANYQLALAAYQQAGVVRGLAETHHNIAISRLHLGDLRGALSAAEQAVRLAMQIGDERLRAQAQAGRAEVHLRAGDPDLAAAELERVAATYEKLSHPVGLAEAWRLQAAVVATRRHYAAAVQLLERAADLAQAHGSAHTLAEIERDLAEAFDASGDAASARAARERAAALYRRLGATAMAERLTSRSAGSPS